MLNAETHRIEKLTYPRAYYHKLYYYYALSDNYYFFFYHSEIMALKVVAACAAWCQSGICKRRMSRLEQHGTVATSSSILYGVTWYDSIKVCYDDVIILKINKGASLALSLSALFSCSYCSNCSFFLPLLLFLPFSAFFFFFFFDCSHCSFGSLFLFSALLVLFLLFSALYCSFCPFRYLRS